MATLAYLGDSGIVLGEVDTEGIDWRWVGDDLWAPSPAPRELVGDRSGGHGTWDGTEFYGPRTHAFRGVATGSHEALHRAKQRLQAAVSIRPFTLRGVEPGYDRRATVRRGGEVLWTETDPGNADWSIALYQPDPFIYAVEPYTAQAGLPLQSGGLSWPTSWSSNWDAIVTSGAMEVTNQGNEMSYPTVRVYGPLPDFTLARPETGEQLTVDLGADGEELADGEWLEVDMRTQTVRLLGQASRRRSLRGDFFGLPPGDSTIMFASSVYNATARAELTGYSTWI